MKYNSIVNVLCNLQIQTQCQTRSDIFLDPSLFPAGVWLLGKLASLRRRLATSVMLPGLNLGDTNAEPLRFLLPTLNPRIDVGGQNA